MTSFAATYHDLVAIEVNVLDPQRQAFDQAEAAAVEHFRDEAEERIEGAEEPLNLTTGEDRGKVLRATGALQAFQGGHFQAQDAIVEEDDGAKGLILRRSCDPSTHGEVVQECRGFGGPHFSGIATRAWRRAVHSDRRLKEGPCARSCLHAAWIV
jgi:hypothetical protein